MTIKSSICINSLPLKARSKNMPLTGELEEMQTLRPTQTHGDRISILTRSPGDLTFEKPGLMSMGIL